jgi:hypothetical protein
MVKPTGTLDVAVLHARKRRATRCFDIPSGRHRPCEVTSRYSGRALGRAAPAGGYGRPMEGRFAPAHTALGADNDYYGLADLGIRTGTSARLRTFDSTILCRPHSDVDRIRLAAPCAGHGEPNQRLRDDPDQRLRDGEDHACPTCPMRPEMSWLEVEEGRADHVAGIEAGLGRRESWPPGDPGGLEARVDGRIRHEATVSETGVGVTRQARGARRRRGGGLSVGEVAEVGLLDGGAPVAIGDLLVVAVKGRPNWSRAGRPN